MLKTKNKPNYKSVHSFDKRKSEALKIREKYPERVPVIVEKNNKDNLKLDKQKFLCPGNITVGHFLFTLRKHTMLEPYHALYLFVNNTLPPITMLMSQLHSEYGEDCGDGMRGFVFVTLQRENTFG